MHKLWSVAWIDLTLTCRSRENWLYLLVLPALVTFLVGLAAQGFARAIPRAVRVDVLDQDSSAASGELLAALREDNEILLICPAVGDPEDGCLLGGAVLTPSLAEERLAGEVTFGTLTIPAGLGAALGAGEGASVRFRSNSALAAPEVVYQAVQGAATQAGGAIIAANLSTQTADALGMVTGPEFTAVRRAEAEASWGPPPPVRVTSEVIGRRDRTLLGAQLLENGFALSSPNITVLFVLISILGMTQSLAEERMLGILRRLGTMPVSKVQWLGGRVLSVHLLGLGQIAILLILGTFLGVDYGRAPLALALLANGYVLACTALALALATVVRTPKQASGIATLAWGVLAPLGGAWWPLSLVPAWMQTLGHLSPLAWCLDGFNALVLRQGTLRDVVVPVGVLLLFAVACFAFAVNRFSHQPAEAGNRSPLRGFLAIANKSSLLS